MHSYLFAYFIVALILHLSHVFDRQLFLRGMPHLCYKMRRPTRARVDADPDFNPDFYRLSMVAPLPNQDMNNLIGMNNVGNGSNVSSLPGMGLQNFGLSSMGGMNNMAGMSGLGGMNNLTGMNSVDSSLAANALMQQQLQQSQGGNVGQQIPGLSQGLQNGGNNLMGLASGNSELGQLEALRQRREELVRQLQRMVNTGNTNSLAQAAAPSTNTNGILNPNTAANSGASLQNSFGNTGGVGSLLNSNLGGANTTAQLQQMMSLGMNGSSGQNYSPGSFGGNASTVGLNMNNLTNSFPGGMGGINQQLLMQNNMGGGGGVNSNFGLGGMNANMMSQNLGMMLQANQLMGQQQGNNNYGSSSSEGNPFGDSNTPASS